MEFEKIVSISGKAGLFLIVSSRSNGMVVKSLLDDKSQFVSARIYGFSVLENVSIYTNIDSTPLRDIFITLQKQVEAGKSMPEANSKSDVLFDWFKTIEPDFDAEKVYASDLKKLIKWYHLLASKDAIPDKTTAEFEASKPSEEEE